ncbi:MAG: pyridoxal-5'-phosphate-dependent protein beta subunit [Acidobacteria bacterium]|nr:MAG: pyridoxal-5'-phosphate-dependent protein beta subunit [Acidobacteriota bacterium]
MAIDRIELKDLREAQEIIRPFVHRTPMFTSRYLQTRTGCEIFLKAELFQKTGSFKPRGALNRLKHFSPAEKAHGIVSCSAGNHAQAVAFVCGLEKIACTVVMPSKAQQNKIDATRAYGATVILHDDIRTIFDRTEEVRSERNAVLLHPFNDPYVIAGQGTVGLEIFEDAPDLDTVVVGIGGGGLISGIGLALKKLNPKIRVIGVEPEGAQTMTLALKEKRPVRVERIETVADGLAAPIVGEWNLRCVQEYVDDVILVSDQEIIDAVKLLLERTKLLVEPGAAAATAALLAGKISNPGRKVGLVLSGGNLDLARLKSWL